MTASRHTQPSAPRSLAGLALAATLWLCLAGTAPRLQAQSQHINDLYAAVETSTSLHYTRWVCTGDTLDIQHDEVNGTVTLVDGFWIYTTELTRDFWRWFYNQQYYPAADDTIPLTGVSDDDIDSLCRAINLSIHQNWRIPTKEEWLFAFHGGMLSEHYANYAGSNNADFVAWHRDNSGGKLHNVALRIPNELGLYDMSGNAAEMVSSGDSVVFMGGSFLDDASQPGDFLLSQPPPEARGFRLVLHEPLWFDKDNNRIFYRPTTH